MAADIATFNKDAVRSSLYKIREDIEIAKKLPKNMPEFYSPGEIASSALSVIDDWLAGGVEPAACKALASSLMTDRDLIRSSGKPLDWRIAHLCSAVWYDSIGMAPSAESCMRCSL